MAAHISVEQVGTTTIVSFPPETNLDALTVEDVRQPLTEAVEAASGAVILDAGHVHFASSPAIGMLVTLRLKAARNGGRLMLAGLRQNIAGVLEVMQMTQLFEMFPSVAEAQAAAG